MADEMLEVALEAASEGDLTLSEALDLVRRVVNSGEPYTRAQTLNIMGAISRAYVKVEEDPNSLTLEMFLQMRELRELTERQAQKVLQQALGKTRERPN